MSKTIAEKAIEMSEANVALTAQLSSHLATISSLKAQVDDLAAKVSALESDKTSLIENANARTAERDALAAQIKELSATLSINPQVQQAAGTEPLPDATRSAPETTVKTWQQALADCGGDYAKARAKHPAVFDAYIEAHKNDSK